MRTLFAAVAAALALAVPGGAGAGPLTQDPCPGSVRGPEVVRSFGSDVLENLHVGADGWLYVSNASRGEVVGMHAMLDESRRFAVPSPGAIVERGGSLLVNFGNSISNAVTRTPAAGVLLLDPVTGARSTFASGMTMANGSAVDGDGNLYVSNDFDRRLWRVSPAGDVVLWSDEVYSTNGLAVIGGSLYAALTFDQRSPIERFSLADPADHETAAQLTFGVATFEPGVHTNGDPSKPLLGVKGLDDMTAGPDGMLYVVANGTGELLRVDPATGDACLIAGGLQNPSSVRIAPAGSGWERPGEITFYVTEFSGALRSVGYAPAA